MNRLVTFAAQVAAVIEAEQSDNLPVDGLAEGLRRTGFLRGMEPKSRRGAGKKGHTPWFLAGLEKTILSPPGTRAHSAARKKLGGIVRPESVVLGDVDAGRKEDGAKHQTGNGSPTKQIGGSRPLRGFTANSPRH